MKKVGISILLLVAAALSFTACGSGDQLPSTSVPATEPGQIIFTEEFSVEVELPIEVELIYGPPQEVYVGEPIACTYQIFNGGSTAVEMAYHLRVEGIESSKEPINATFTHCDEQGCQTSVVTQATVEYWYLEVDPDGYWGPKIPWHYSSGKPIVLPGYGEHILYVTVVPPPEQGAGNVGIKVEINVLGVAEDNTPKG